jgi:hypothetical protein
MDLAEPVHRDARPGMSQERCRQESEYQGSAHQPRALERYSIVGHAPLRGRLGRQRYLRESAIVQSQGVKRTAKPCR